jgi:hypothetical protein
MFVLARYLERPLADVFELIAQVQCVLTSAKGNYQSTVLRSLVVQIVNQLQFKLWMIRQKKELCDMHYESFMSVINKI